MASGEWVNWPGQLKYNKSNQVQQRTGGLGGNNNGQQPPAQIAGSLRYWVVAQMLFWAEPKARVTVVVTQCGQVPSQHNMLSTVPIRVCHGLQVNRRPHGPPAGGPTLQSPPRNEGNGLCSLGQVWVRPNVNNWLPNVARSHTGPMAWKVLPWVINNGPVTGRTNPTPGRKHGRLRHKNWEWCHLQY